MAPATAGARTRPNLLSAMLLGTAAMSSSVRLTEHPMQATGYLITWRKHAASLSAAA